MYPDFVSPKRVCLLCGNVLYSDITVHVFARFAVEKISFLTPLEDVILEHVGVKGVFECEISKKGLKPEWFHKDKPISKGLK